jgi:hypothetical protein
MMAKVVANRLKIRQSGNSALQERVCTSPFYSISGSAPFLFLFDIYVILTKNWAFYLSSENKRKIKFVIK